MTVFFHIGAPRTGTSFLRKNIFNSFENLNFFNKENDVNETVSNFSMLAHLSDGDELSLRLDDIVFPDFKEDVLFSDEHFIWSVYHMMGNIRSRAHILKDKIPNIKIILTIRNQPDYFISLYQYLSKRNNGKLSYQFKSIYRMTGVEISRKLQFKPTFHVERELRQLDIHTKYFKRNERPFIANDFSWLKLHDIYTEVFGLNNVLVLPQELIEQDLPSVIKALESFFDKKYTGEYSFQEKTNASIKCKLFKSENDKLQFENFILSLVGRSNIILNDRLNGVLDGFNYFEK